jgi:hypothetical protein
MIEFLNLNKKNDKLNEKSLMIEVIPKRRVDSY